MIRKVRLAGIGIVIFFNILIFTINSFAAGQYTVQQGDTLWSIAKKFDVKVEEILKVNNLQNPDQIQIGDKLSLPDSANPNIISQKKDKDTSNTQPRVGVVLGGSVNIRENPNLNANIITTATREEKYKIIAQSGNWFQIILPNGQSGWINGDYFSESGQSVSRGGGRGIVDIAFRYIGSPYRMGGTTPSGFDCSGFVRAVYSTIGMDLPHSSSEMFKLGERINLDDASPGDLVFFTTYSSGPSHVGIYVGNGNFISSTSSRGVVVTSLNDSYWGARFIGVRKII